MRDRITRKVSRLRDPHRAGRGTDACGFPRPQSDRPNYSRSRIDTQRRRIVFSPLVRSRCRRNWLVRKESFPVTKKIGLKHVFSRLSSTLFDPVPFPSHRAISIIPPPLDPVHRNLHTPFPACSRAFSLSKTRKAARETTNGRNRGKRKEGSIVLVPVRSTRSSLRSGPFRRAFERKQRMASE